MKVYVDGSYSIQSRNVAGYAAVPVISESDTNYVCDVVFGVELEREAVSARNVGGEIRAVLEGCKYVIETYPDEAIEIFHDYKGLSEWPNGKWKCNLKLTREYAEAINEMRKTREITFTHVFAHRGVQLNELADSYANVAVSDYVNKSISSNIQKNIEIIKTTI